MIKQAPSPGRIFAMVIFALSCFGILLFIWITFGGPTPLRAESYRFSVSIPEAPTLSVEADVRIAGVSVGKVKSKQRDEDAPRTLVEVEVEPRYAPIPKDTRAALRQKTLLGENYLELTPGHESEGNLPDGGRLPDRQVQETTELDEIFSAFDTETQTALAELAKQGARALRGSGSEDLNDALGNLPELAEDSGRVLGVLDRQEISLRRLVKNAGVVFGALNERRGALGELVRSGDATFEALAAQDDALAETVTVLPATLEETRLTTARLARSLVAARPLIADLGPAADDLAPTLRDLGDLAPDLRATFRSTDALTRASRRGLPALGRTVRGAEPVMEALPPFTRELVPVVSMLGFYQQRVASFLANGGAPLQYEFGGNHALANTAVVDPRSFSTYTTRPEFDRGYAYLQPNVFNRVAAFGAYESADCSNAVGRRNRYGDVRPNDALDDPLPLKAFTRRPTCIQAGGSLYDGKLFSMPRAVVKRAPRGLEGTTPIEGRP